MREKSVQISQYSHVEVGERMAYGFKIVDFER